MAQSTKRGVDLAKAYPYPAGRARISGTVARAGSPVPNATIRLVGTTYAARVDRTGHFEFPVMSTSANNTPTYQVVAEAPGFGTHAIATVPLFDRQEVILHFDVPGAGQAKTNPGFKLPSRSHRRAVNSALAQVVAGGVLQEPADTAGAADLSVASLGVQQFAIASDTTPPPYIRISISSNLDPGACPFPDADYVRTDDVSFYDYVKWVLPHEWQPSWDMPSLQAGASAVRNYGWYWVNQGGGVRGDLSNTTCDQVYDPTTETSATDEAVAATFTTGFYLAGTATAPQSNYVLGVQTDTQVPPFYNGQYWPGFMSQYGSQTLAQQGRSYQEILEWYYGPLNYFTIVPPAPQPTPTSYVSGQNATWDYTTPGATSYQVQQWNYATSSWNTVYQGPNFTVALGPANDGTQYVAISVTAYDAAGWSESSGHNGYADIDLTSGSTLGVPTVRAFDISDTGFCLGMGDSDAAVAYFGIWHFVSGTWQWVAQVNLGAQNQARCGLAAEDQQHSTTYYVSGPPTAYLEYGVVGYSADGSTSSNGSGVGVTDYDVGY